MKPSNRYDVSAVLETIPELCVMRSGLISVRASEPLAESMLERFTYETRYNPEPVISDVGAFIPGETWKPRAQFNIYHEEEHIVLQAAKLVLAQRRLGGVRNRLTGRTTAAVRIHNHFETERKYRMWEKIT